MTPVRTDVETLSFLSPDGKREVFVIPSQVFAVTTVQAGTTCLIGPQNAVVFVDGTVKDARDKLVAALKHVPNKGDL